MHEETGCSCLHGPHQYILTAQQQSGAHGRPPYTVLEPELGGACALATSEPPLRKANQSLANCRLASAILCMFSRCWPSHTAKHCYPLSQACTTSAHLPYRAVNSQPIPGETQHCTIFLPHILSLNSELTESPKIFHKAWLVFILFLKFQR